MVEGCGVGGVGENTGLGYGCRVLGENAGCGSTATWSATTPQDDQSAAPNLVGFTSKSTSILTNITSKFTDILDIRVALVIRSLVFAVFFHAMISHRPPVFFRGSSFRGSARSR